MPFTLSHPAVVLPFARWKLILSALVIGSMTPDFEYFIDIVTDHDVQIGHSISGIFLFCIPVGLLVSNLLFLNEFPDFEADVKTGRKHGLIRLGRKRASKLYTLILFSTFISIIVPVIFSIFPVTTLITLIVLPLSVRTSKNVLRNYDYPNKLIPSLAQNTIIALVTPILLSSGLLLGSII